jgi:hypothetical protein
LYLLLLAILFSLRSGSGMTTTSNILAIHDCRWLSKKYIKLNWSGDGVHVPDKMGATQAHVRELSFGEVMRWSLLPRTTELRQMYERQRVVFGCGLFFFFLRFIA